MLTLRKRTFSTALTLGLISTCALVAVVVLTSSAGARGIAGNYSHDDDDTDCNGSATDPVSVLFTGTEADVDNTARSIIEHREWPFRGVGDETQRLKVFRPSSATKQCLLNEDGLSSLPFGDDDLDRFHIRLWRTQRPERRNRTAGTPHWDRLDFTCGHFVVDYNYTPSGLGGYVATRNRLVRAFRQADAHRIQWAYWGNTRQIDQCEDHGPVGNDGYVAFITLNHEH